MRLRSVFNISYAFYYRETLVHPEAEETPEETAKGCVSSCIGLQSVQRAKSKNKRKSQSSLNTGAEENFQRAVSIRLKVSVLIYSSAWVFLTVAHFACEIYSVLAVQKVLLTNCQLDLCLVETHWAKGENRVGGGDMSSILRHCCLVLQFKAVLISAEQSCLSLVAY